MHLVHPSAAPRPHSITQAWGIYWLRSQHVTIHHSLITHWPVHTQSIHLKLLDLVHPLHVYSLAYPHKYHFHLPKTIFPERCITVQWIYDSDLGVTDCVGWWNDRGVVFVCSMCGLLCVSRIRAPQAEVPPTRNCRIVYVDQRRGPAEVPLTRENHMFCNIVTEPMPWN